MNTFFKRTETKGIIPQNNDTVRIQIPLKTGGYWEKEYNQGDIIQNIIDDFKKENNEEIPEDYMADWKFKNKTLKMTDEIRTLLVTPILVISHNDRKKVIELGEEKIPDIIGKPFNEPFEIFTFNKNNKILKTQKYDDDETLIDYNSSSAYCNGNNHLFISGGETIDNRIIDKLWSINLENKDVKTINMSPKKNHSMIYIPGNYVFIVGGNDLKTFYYNINDNEMCEWADLNKKRTEPALILISNDLYCIDNVNSKNNDEKFSLEKTDITSEIPKWEKIVPDLKLPFGFEKINQKFFGVVKNDDNNILFLGGNMDEDENNYINKNNYIYNIESNSIEESNIPFQEYNFKEKTFLPYNKNIDYILPDFNRHHPEVIFYQKNKKKLNLVKYEPKQSKKLRNTLKPLIDCRYNFNMPDFSLPTNENYNYKGNPCINIEGPIIDKKENRFSDNRLNINNNAPSLNASDNNEELPLLKEILVYPNSSLIDKEKEDNIEKIIQQTYINNNININLIDDNSKPKTDGECDGNEKNHDNKKIINSSIENVPPKIEVKPIPYKANLKDVQIIADDKSNYYVKGIILGTKTRIMDVQNPDININEAKNININGPKVDINGPNVDLKETNADLNVKVPGINVKTSNINMSSKNNEIKGIDINNNINGNINIKNPKIVEPNFFKDGIIQGTKSKNIKVDVPSSKIDINGPKINSPNIEINGNSPKTNIEVPSPKIEINNKYNKSELIQDKKQLDLKVPNVSINVPKNNAQLSNNIEGKIPEFDFKAPKTDLPTGSGNFGEIKIEAPKIEVNNNLKGVNLKSKGDLNKNLPGGDTKINVDSPNLKIKESNIDLKGSNKSILIDKKDEYKYTGFITGKKNLNYKADINGKSLNISENNNKINMNGNMHGIEINAPKVDINPDINVKRTNADLTGAIPDINVKRTNADLAGAIPEINIKSPNINMPSGNIEIKETKINNDINGNIPNLNLKGPKIEGVSNIDFDIKDNSNPKIDVTGPKLNGNIDGKINLKDNIPGINVNIPEGEIKSKNIEIQGPNVNREISDSNVFFLSGIIPQKNNINKNSEITYPGVGVSVKNSSINTKGDFNYLNNSKFKRSFHGNLDDKNYNMIYGKDIKGSRRVDVPNKFDIEIPKVKINNSGKLKESANIGIGESFKGNYKLENNPIQLGVKADEDHKYGINVNFDKGIKTENINLNDLGKNSISEDVNNENKVSNISGNIEFKKKGKGLPKVGLKSSNFEPSKVDIAGKFDTDNINVDNLQSANVGVNGQKIGEKIIE